MTQIPSARIALLIAAAGVAAIPRAAAAQPAVGEEVVEIVSEPVSPSDEMAQALRNLDGSRLHSDEAYAATILGYLDRISLDRSANEAAGEIDALRLIALVTLRRTEEAVTTFDRMLARRPTQAQGYAIPWISALRLPDLPRAVNLVEQASRDLRASEWPALRELIDQNSVGMMLQVLRERGDEAARVRLAESLYRIGWPGAQQRDSADSFRATILDDRLRRGDRAGAAEIAGLISTPSRLLPLLLLRRYEGLLASREDPIALLRQALAEQDRHTAEALAAAPQDLMRVTSRIDFLRSVNRDEEALALLQPFTRDVAATVASHPQGMFAVNVAASLFMTLGRKAEGMALMDRLSALEIEANPMLVNVRINHAGMLWYAGRHSEALETALRLQRGHDGLVNEFGRMWIYSTIVCSLEGLGRAAEAAPWMERMRGPGNHNPVALTRAYLCLGDMEGAEATMLARIEGDNPNSAVLAFQHYTLRETPEEEIDHRVAELRQRPALRQAVERVGRVLELPLSERYWVSF